MEIPCKPDCPNRRAACHSVCPEYKAFRKYLDEKNEEIRKGNEVFNYNGIRKARIKEIMRRINKRGGDGG
jgi:hypothetical protein